MCSGIKRNGGADPAETPGSKEYVFGTVGSPIELQNYRRQSSKGEVNVALPNLGFSMLGWLQLSKVIKCVVVQ